MYVPWKLTKSKKLMDRMTVATRQWHPALDCQEPNCSLKRCTAINSRYCFPHTVDKIETVKPPLEPGSIKSILLSLVELNQP